MTDENKQSTSKLQRLENSIEKLTRVYPPPPQLQVFERINLLANPPGASLAQQIKATVPLWLEDFKAHNFLPQPLLDFCGTMNTFQQSFKNSLPQLPDYLSKIGRIALSLHESLEQLDENQKKTVEYCIAHGWYPIVEMSTSYISDEENFEQIFENYIEKRIDEIENNVCESNPNRSDIIRDAFGAHRTGKYTLSIPAILAQADGICNERLEISPFSKKPGKQLQDKIPSEIYSDFLCHYFQPVIFAKEIRANTEDVPPSTLNRHHVLHGISKEYATHRNSLKAISYIGSLDWLLRELEEVQKEQKMGIKNNFAHEDAATA